MTSLKFPTGASIFPAKCFRCDLAFTEEELNGLHVWEEIQGRMFRLHLQCDKLYRREAIIHALEVNSTKVS